MLLNPFPTTIVYPLVFAVFAKSIHQSLCYRSSFFLELQHPSRAANIFMLHTVTADTSCGCFASSLTPAVTAAAAAAAASVGSCSTSSTFSTTAMVW